MKGNAYLTALCIVVLIPLLASCGTKKQPEKTPAPPVAETVRPAEPLPTLPVRYQTPGYITPQTDPLAGMLADNARKEHQIRVGATIRSTGGPLPLWDVMKRLTALKEMTVSWASDVDQTMPVDVDISADEGFFDAIANLLRQVDYFHEVNGRTIIVRNKTTKTYQIAIPLMQGGYTSTVGGNFLAGKEETSGSEGTVKITSAENKFNVWENIEANLRTLLDIDAAERAAVRQSMAANMQEARRAEARTDMEEGAENVPPDGATTATADTAGQEAGASIGQNSASDGSSFMVDRSIGLITVTAKPSVLKKVDEYVENLKKHLFRQVSIEAKIIEVYLEDQSKIGLDWSSILRNFRVSATTEFGSAGQVHPHTSGGNPDRYSNTFVSRVFMPSLNFTVFLNALKEQGDTQVLANPRLTVLNGQPALISVGKDVAYVKEVNMEVSGTGADRTTTYSAEAGNVVQGIALGVMPSIVDNSKVILHLTPITTDLENLDEHGDVPMRDVTGDGSIRLGLPRVKVREMSTMVEVLDGEMLIIGGLIDSLEGNKGSGLPGVSKIPVLKYLFGYEEKIKQKRELVILLTPKIL